MISLFRLFLQSGYYRWRASDGAVARGRGDSGGRAAARLFEWREEEE
jgi:hypothetical protein